MKKDPTLFLLCQAATKMAVGLLLVMVLLSGLRLWFYDLTTLSATQFETINRWIPFEKAYSWHNLFGLMLISTAAGWLLLLLFKRALGYRNVDARGVYVGRFSTIPVLIPLLIIALYSGLSLLLGNYDTVKQLVWLRQIHRILLPLSLIVLTLTIIELVKRRPKALPKPSGSLILNTLALSVVLLIAASIWIIYKSSATTTPQLVCEKTRHRIELDGIGNETAWHEADEVKLSISNGVNFPGGASVATIRGVRDAQNIFFLVKWADPERSYNRFIEKTPGGWNEVKDDLNAITGDTVHYEDQLALSFHRDEKGCLGSCHSRTLPEAVVHHTERDTADIWFWQAVSSNPVGQARDGWWGGSDLLPGKQGSTHLDNIAAGGVYLNLDLDWRQPYFLPAYGDARFWIELNDDHVHPYSSEYDVYAIGTRLPAVLVAPVMGDGGDVRARGVWNSGYWTVEFSRPLKTGSPYDLPFQGDVYLSIAPFNNAAQRHGYAKHVIRLVMK